LKKKLKRKLKKIKCSTNLKVSFDSFIMKKNILVLISLVTSLVGLVLIYIATINLEAKQVELKDINAELIGRSVATTGEIVYRRTHDAGHLFLTISDDDIKIAVPLFVGYLNDLKEVGLTEDDFQVGTKISISGLVDEYQGQLQVIPRRKDDVKILSE
jgi:DNA/RNA endonuclease YhcR with UshA esterase domain